MNWTIRNRLLAGCGVLVAVLGLACLLGWQQAATSEKRISTVIKSNQADLDQLLLVETSEQGGIAACTAELRFLLKKDVSFAQAVGAKLAEIRNLLGKVSDQTSDTSQKQALANALEVANRYEAAFKNTRDLLTRRGLTPDAGLEGELREAAHQIEAAVKEQGIAELEILLVQCRRHEKDYMLRGDPSYIDQIAKRIEEFGKQMTLFSLPEATRAKATACWKTYADAMSNIVTVDQQIKAAGADSQAASAQFQKTMQDLSASTSAAITTSQKHALSLMASGKMFMLVLLAVGVALGAVVVLILTRSITKPISLAVESISASAEQTSCASGQVSSASQSLAEGASDQAASLEETSASLEEMTGMVKRNAEAAQRAKELANQTRAAADAGASDMREMQAAMGEIKASSDSVSRILKDIDEIAFQTNILALNAAVEAARAGEAGMGFAVVADEVRNLAQRSAKAAKDTAGKIEDAISKTQRGVDLSARVAKNFDEIAGKTREVDQYVAEIASASTEQSQGIVQIGAAMTQMDKATQANAASAEENASASEELGAQAESLQTAVRSLQQLVGSASEAESQPRATAPAAEPAPGRPATPAAHARKPAPAGGNGSLKRQTVSQHATLVGNGSGELPMHAVEEFRNF